MGTRPKYIRASNPCAAWVRVAEAVTVPGVNALTPLTLVMTGLEDWADVGRVSAGDPVRRRVDDALAAAKLASTQTVANTIFPAETWERAKRGGGRARLYARHARVVERFGLRNRANLRGLYFGRMTGAGRGAQAVNQVEHLITAYKAGVRRPTALQLVVFNPGHDHTLERRRGFPCLQSVGFTPLGPGKLGMTAVYPCQYLFQRGLGNYIGLIRLGRFVAHELDLDLSQLTCWVGKLTVDKGTTRRDLRRLARCPQPVTANPTQPATTPGGDGRV